MHPAYIKTCGSAEKIVGKKFRISYEVDSRFKISAQAQWNAFKYIFCPADGIYTENTLRTAIVIPVPLAAMKTAAEENAPGRIRQYDMILSKPYDSETGTVAAQYAAGIELAFQRQVVCHEKFGCSATAIGCKPQPEGYITLLRLCR